MWFIDFFSWLCLWCNWYCCYVDPWLWISAFTVMRCLFKYFLGQKIQNWASQPSTHFPHYLSLYSSLMSDVIKAEEILPDSTICGVCVYWIAFKKPGADTPGKRDDLDYDIGNMEATDNHQVNMEVRIVSQTKWLICRSLKLTKRLIFFELPEITHSFLSIICLNCLQKTRM